MGRRGRALYETGQRIQSQTHQLGWVAGRTRELGWDGGSNLVQGLWGCRKKKLQLEKILILWRRGNDASV